MSLFSFPKPSLRVMLVQSCPAWGRAEESFKAVEDLLGLAACGAAVAACDGSGGAGLSVAGSSDAAAVSASPDLIVLPEMFATGFALPVEEALPQSERVLRWMQTLARNTGAVVAGTGAARDEAGRAVNRMWWVRPDGTHTFYDKRHLFGLGQEKRDYTPGAPHEPIEIAGWRVLPGICYDLRFPDYNRNWLVRGAARGADAHTLCAASAVGIPARAADAAQGAAPTAPYAYDLLLFAAAWPTARVAHWQLLLQARAVENMAYVVGVNRVGKDGDGLAYGGSSMAVSPQGVVLWQGDGQTASATCVNLNWNDLAAYRQRFPVAEDWSEKAEPARPTDGKSRRANEQNRRADEQNK